MGQVYSNGGKMIYDTKYIFLIILLIVSVYFDLRFRKIPNCLILAGVVAGVLLNTLTNGLNGFLGSIYGLILGIVLLVLPFALGGIGAGDVKLLGVVGAVNGTALVFQTFLVMAVWGGLISFILLLRSGQLLKILKWFTGLIKEFLMAAVLKGRYMITLKPMPSTGMSLPYAVPLFMGTVTLFLIGGFL